jgi:hypothetical protein
MRKFLLFWVTPLTCVGVAAATFAGPCYKNTFGGAPPACVWGPGVIGAAGPCPWGPSQFNIPATCGSYTVNVATPTGTSGNEPTGSMNQGNVPFTCKNHFTCTRFMVVTPIWPPVATVACTPGAPLAVATAWPWAAMGGVCPTPPGGGGGTVIVAPETFVPQ